MNPRKLKPGDRILWDNRVEEVVIDINEDVFKTVDFDGSVHEYSIEGKITNCKKISKYDSTIYIDDLIGRMETDFVNHCRKFANTISKLEKLL